MMYGDPDQLKPPVMSGRANEFSGNAKLSPMALLIEKKHDFIQFLEQYRMDPEMSAFPSQRFYSNLLRNHACTITANETKDAIFTEYGVKAPDGKGALYWIRNVVNSATRHEENGSSLQNFANVNAFAAQLADSKKYGIRPEQITILTLYRGQRNLLVQKLRPKGSDDGTASHKMYSEVTTVDSYQGKEKDVVILDKAAANPKAGLKGTPDTDVRGKEADEEEAASSPGSKGSRRYDHISRYAKDKNRLNVGLTRAHFALVVIMQVAGALRTSKQNPTKTVEYSDLCALVKDAAARAVIYNDITSEDDHPEAIAARKRQDEKVSISNRELLQSEALAFIRSAVEKSHLGQKGQNPGRNCQATAPVAAGPGPSSFMPPPSFMQGVTKTNKQRKDEKKARAAKKKKADEVAEAAKMLEKPTRKKYSKKDGADQKRIVAEIRAGIRLDDKID